jgi:hypothetical protein
LIRIRIRIWIRIETNVDPQRCMQSFLMVVIMLTGNYNFFNFLYMALCLSLADNSWLGMVRFYMIVFFMCVYVLINVMDW